MDYGGGTRRKACGRRGPTAQGRQRDRFRGPADDIDDGPDGSRCRTDALPVGHATFGETGDPRCYFTFI